MKFVCFLLTSLLIDGAFCRITVSTTANTIKDDSEVVSKSSTEPNDPLLNMRETNDIADYEIVDGDILLYDYGKNIDVQYDAIAEPSRLWPKKGRYIVIPYTQTENLLDYEQSQIDRAIQEFHSKTPIRFVPRNQESDYIHIEMNTNRCLSTVGRKGGKQKVNAGGCKVDQKLWWGRICHELYHVLGFTHEHNRDDREEYLDVDYDAIELVEKSDFRIGHYLGRYKKCSLSKLGKKYGCKKINSYDGNSISHYPPILGDIQPKKIFISKKKCNGQTVNMDKEHL